MKIHELKTDSAVFAAVAAGDKTHEIRLNDRHFAVGDILHLRETSATGAEIRNGAPLVYTGRQALREVSHIQTGFGLEDGWVILSFRQGFGRLYNEPPAMPLEWGTPDALYPAYRSFAPADRAPQPSTANQSHPYHRDLAGLNEFINKMCSNNPQLNTQLIACAEAAWNFCMERNHPANAPAAAMTAGTIDTPIFRNLLAAWWATVGSEDEQAAAVALLVLVEHIDRFATSTTERTI